MKTIFTCNCDPQTFWECGGMCPEQCEYATPKLGKTMALCEGRHEFPEDVDGYIFPNIIEDPTDVGALTDTAIAAIGEDVVQLRLYVTGMSVALCAVINACRVRNINLVLLHYDRNTGSYYEQIIY